jgi:predicted DNA-binding protein
MATQTQHETMQRKPILMPPEMISKIDKIARGRNVSFAKVVREAIDAFDENLAMENTELLEALADTMIQTTKDVVEKIEAIEKKLDETHTLLEDQS